jgi:PleD family two-component response regulator
VLDSRFDLILLDMNMPGMGGLETCRSIRATSEVAVIMLTVHDTEHDKVAALDAGADDYVTKPFGMPLCGACPLRLSRGPSRFDWAKSRSIWPRGDLFPRPDGLT